MKDSSDTIQEPGQSGRGSTGAGVVVVVVVVVGLGVVRGTLKMDRIRRLVQKIDFCI